MPISEEFLRRVCVLNPSPWDDQRYMLRSPTYKELVEIPEEFSVIEVKDLPGPYPDQGEIGSCVGWSWSLWMRVTNLFLDTEPDILSAWDAYNKARKYDGLPDFLEGSTNLGAAKGIQKLGICLEDCLPTPIKKPVVEPSPCSDYDLQCSVYGIDAYYQVPVTWGAFKSAMWGQISDPQWDGLVPLVVGYHVLQSWKEVEDDGIVPEPVPGEPILGGHSSLIVGIKLIDGKRYLVNLNSWGTDCGDGGVFYIPESYVTGGLIIDSWVGHNGPPIENGSSDCVIGVRVAEALSLVARALGRRGKFKYFNP